MRDRRVWIAVGLALLLGGCAGRGDTVMLYPGAVRLSPGDAAAPTDRLKAVIVPFEDGRAKKGTIGKRVHAGGGETLYKVWGDNPGQVVAEFMADYLKQKGWDVDVRTVEQSGQEPPADVTIRGRVQEFAADAVSRPGSTIIETKMLVSLKVAHPNGDPERMTLQGARREKVVVFNDRDVQAALNTMMKESLDRLMADTKVEHRTWRVR